MRNESKRKLGIALTVLLLTSMVFLSGCIGGEQNPVKTQEDVTEAVTDISTNVENVESTLEDVDRILGGE